MLGLIARWLVVLTAISLNLVLLWGMATQEAVVGKSAGFNLLVNTMLGLLLITSFVVVRVNWASQRSWSLAFGFNFLLILLPSIFKKLGLVYFGPPFLFCLDLYWLNLCLVYLSLSSKDRHSNG